MNTENNKRTYSAPTIEKIDLNNEISILMMSTPTPSYPDGFSKVNMEHQSTPFGEELMG